MHIDNSVDEKAHWERRVFSPLATSLIADIQQLGGEAELARRLDLFRKELETALQQVRDHLMIDAMDRGLER